MICIFTIHVGVGYFLRKIGNATSPTVWLEKHGDDYEFHTESTFKNTIIRFRPGQEFEEETLDGRVVKSVIEIDGATNTMTQTQKTDKKSTLVRVFSDKEMVLTATYGDVVSKRWYKAD